ncbi:actin-binding Rho-activating protein-like [Stylophora pistillata]|uniref:actin-binding Rho-activating protein-like n=1 Tax=Stylophora pistillata TaxID=50429 RepID=UPI000C056E2C|nr:actin-binding Rho-activating protein-like [Stylophora pistillata]
MHTPRFTAGVALVGYRRVWRWLTWLMAAPLRNDKEYGRPVAGSKTETRGRFAGAHISQEVKQLCKIIAQMGEEQPDRTITVTFRRLFERYTGISNKVVGMLLRARKQNLFCFEGEMLFQRRDDDVIITLPRMPEEVENDSDEYWNIRAR